MKNNKKAQQVTGFMVLLGVIIAGFAIGIVTDSFAQTWDLLRQSSETENSFYALSGRINSLIADNEDYSYTHMAYGINSNHGLFGFDTFWDDEKPVMFMEPCDENNRCRHAIYKPTKCGTQACLCLIKERTGVLEGGVPFISDQNPKCKYFDGDVNFIAVDRAKAVAQIYETYESGYAINGVEKEVDYGYIDAILEQKMQKFQPDTQVGWFNSNKFVGSDYRYLIITGDEHIVDSRHLDLIKIRKANGDTKEIGQTMAVGGGKWESKNIYIEKYNVGERILILFGSNELRSIKERKDVLKAAYTFKSIVDSYHKCLTNTSGKTLYSVFAPSTLDETCLCKEVKVDLPKGYTVTISNLENKMELWHADYEKVLISEPLRQYGEIASLGVTESVIHHSVFDEKTIDSEISKLSMFRSYDKILIQEPGEDKATVPSCKDVTREIDEKKHLADSFQRMYNTDFEDIYEASPDPCIAARIDLSDIPDQKGDIHYPISVDRSTIYAWEDKSETIAAAKQNRRCYLNRLNNGFEVREADEIIVDSRSTPIAWVEQDNTNKVIYHLNKYPTLYLTKQGSKERACWDPTRVTSNSFMITQGGMQFNSLVSAQRCLIGIDSVRESYASFVKTAIGCANDVMCKDKEVELDLPKGYTLRMDKTDQKMYFRLVKDSVIIAEDSVYNGQSITTPLCINEETVDGIENLGDSTVKMNKDSERRLCISIES